MSTVVNTSLALRFDILAMGIVSCVKADIGCCCETSRLRGQPPVRFGPLLSSYRHERFVGDCSPTSLYLYSMAGPPRC